MIGVMFMGGTIVTPLYSLYAAQRDIRVSPLP